MVGRGGKGGRPGAGVRTSDARRGERQHSWATARAVGDASTGRGGEGRRRGSTHALALKLATPKSADTSTLRGKQGASEPEGRAQALRPPRLLKPARAALARRAGAAWPPAGSAPRVYSLRRGAFFEGGGGVGGGGGELGVAGASRPRVEGRHGGVAHGEDVLICEAGVN